MSVLKVDITMVPSFFLISYLFLPKNCDLSSIVFRQKSTKSSHSASYGITALLASQYIAESLKRSNSRSPSGCTARPRPRDQGLRPMSIHSTVPARPPAARPLVPVQAQRARPPAAGCIERLVRHSLSALSWTSQQSARRIGMTAPRRARLAGARQPGAAHHAHQTAVGRVPHGQGHSVGGSSLDTKETWGGQDPLLTLLLPQCILCIWSVVTFFSKAFIKTYGLFFFFSRLRINWMRKKDWKNWFYGEFYYVAVWLAGCQSWFW